VASNKGKRSNRTHVYRKPKDRAGSKFTGSHHCPECGKWCFRTRDDAVAAVRLLHPGSQARYYKCKSSGVTWWHYTSMDAEQVGEIRAREAVYEDEDNDDEDDEPEATVALNWGVGKHLHREAPLHDKGRRRPAR